MAIVAKGSAVLDDRSVARVRIAGVDDLPQRPGRWQRRPIEPRPALWSRPIPGEIVDGVTDRRPAVAPEVPQIEAVALGDGRDGDAVLERFLGVHDPADLAS